MVVKYKHVSRGKYVGIDKEGKISEPSWRIRQMIKLIYLGELLYPPVGWVVSREKLIKDFKKKPINICV